MDETTIDTTIEAQPEETASVEEAASVEETMSAEEAMSADEAAQLAAFAEAVEEDQQQSILMPAAQEAGFSSTRPANVDEEKFVEGEEKRPPRDIEFLLDIPLLVSVEIGRTRMLIKDLLQLGQGSVIEFDKLVGEPMEVLVNDKLIARGEVVVVNEKFGVRLTDISSPAERLKHLK
ncbi:MAG: flagellar motor switch protein FliN [Syntrophorhabdaceae bacterium]|nr:flagellar motor switch protein FliN [Syntrophorhabdaceae bacterium]